MPKRPSERRQVLAAAIFATVVVAGGLWLLGPSKLPRLRWRAIDHPAPAAAAGETALPAEFVAERETRARIEPSGGAVELPSALGRLDVPAGALGAACDVRACVLHSERDASPVIDLQPDGLALSKPARLALRMPAGIRPDEAEIAVFDASRNEWVPEAVQGPGPEPDELVAEIRHFSLRRIRIRPGLDFPYDPRSARGTFFLASDTGNSFENLVEGRWQSVGRRTPAYRELLKQGRLGRHDLIASGRLRAVAAGPGRSDVMSDDLRAVVLPAGAPEARTGWVRLVRLDESGQLTPFATIARVVNADEALAPKEAGGAIKLSRAAMEALGLTWGEDFGIAGQDAEHAWVRLAAKPGEPALRFVPLRLEPWEPSGKR